MSLTRDLPYCSDQFIWIAALGNHGHCATLERAVRERIDIETTVNDNACLGVGRSQLRHQGQTALTAECQVQQQHIRLTGCDCFDEFSLRGNLCDAAKTGT